MPCHIQILTPAGLRPASYSAESLLDAARYEPDDGVYTIANTFDTTRVLKMDAHLDRLEDSARREGIPLKLDRPHLRGALRHMIENAGFGDVRFRITIARQHPDEFILSVEPFKPLSLDLIAQGVRCVTVPGVARHDPEAKTADWLHDRQTVERALPPGIYTGLLVSDDGEILEGLSSNFYAILDGELRTAGQGVLPGIAQQIVFAVAPGIVTVRRDAVHIAEIPLLDEAFITSSSRGIVPVVEIDGVRLGSGAPGGITLALREAYQAWVENHLEEL